MVFASNGDQSAIEHNEHDFLQSIIFFLILLLSGVAFYLAILPITEMLIQNFLSGVVRNSGESVAYSLQQQLPVEKTSYYSQWAVDLYVKTPDEARYWFNPLLALFLPSALVGIIFAITTTMLFPSKIGFMSKKIEREINNVIHRFSFFKNGYYSRKEEEFFATDIMAASIRDLNEMADELKIPIEDLRILKKALVWQNSNSFVRFMKIKDAIRMYMRMYFTIKHSNTVLGMVYIGAAVLIVIIGLRGLKLVPSTQPSIILFALSLEFCFLIIYAITVIYSKEEIEEDSQQQSSKIEPSLSSTNFGSTKEVERMLRVFLKSGKK